MEPNFGKQSRLSIAIISLTALVMLMWSWQTWCDPLVDFGTQLYVPWQMSLGKIPYLHLAYYNGPLSPYYHWLLFKLFGVSLRTLEMSNLAIVIGVIVLIGRLARRCYGPIAAVAACLSFVLMFAFGQGVAIGNYNWITPYTNEITHGIALGLLMLALLGRFLQQLHRRWLVWAGVALGLVFLTKAEPFVAAASGAAALLVSSWWIRRSPVKTVIGEMASFSGAAVIAPLVMLGLMSLQMPVPVALRAVAGSWPWLFDHRVTALPFYRDISGLDDVPGNLLALLRWSTGYAVIFGAIIFVSLRRRPRGHAGPVLAFALGAIGMWIASRVFDIDWNSMLRPLPVVLGVTLVITAAGIVRRKTGAAGSSLTAGLIVFAGALLIKISLNAHFYHYGFALAMPGTLVLAVLLIQTLPDWIGQRGGHAAVARALFAVIWCTGMFVAIYVDNLFFTHKPVALGIGGDEFRADARGAEVKSMIEQMRTRLPSDATLVVLPQGLMINYLSRHADPIAYLNFMPPEVLAVGEDHIDSALMNHPPDAIVIDTSTLEGDAITMDHRYRYGQATLRWVRANYIAVTVPDPSAPLRLTLLLRKKS